VQNAQNAAFSVRYFASIVQGKVSGEGINPPDPRGPRYFLHLRHVETAI
jgi:hypothetical protein